MSIVLRQLKIYFVSYDSQMLVLRLIFLLSYKKPQLVEL